MKTFAINEARQPSRIGCLVIISSALLGTIGPALSADLPEDMRYWPGYYRDYHDSGYYHDCYHCRCCGWRPYPTAERWPVEKRSSVVEERPIVERIPMSERYWVQRDYIERRYPYYDTRYEYPPYWSYPSSYRYSSYYPAPGAAPYPPHEPAPRGEPPRRIGYGTSYPPAAYEDEAEPRPTYRYVASSRPYDDPGYEYEYYKPRTEYRPVYEYEPSPRPPAPVPGRYGRSGY